MMICNCRIIARAAVVAVMSGLGGMSAAADLAWVPLANTNRAPASVSSPVAVAAAVVAVRGDEQTSAGSNLLTFVPGTLCIIR